MKDLKVEKNFNFEKMFNDTQKYGEMSPLEVLNNGLFNFVCDDFEMEKLFISKALEVSYAIANSKTFEYISKKENNQWFLMMMQTPFFRESTDYGVSIRGAWFNDYVLKNTIFYDGEGKQSWKDIILNADDLNRMMNMAVDYGVGNELVDLSFFERSSKLKSFKA